MSTDYSFRPAYDRQLARILAVPADTVRPVNLDIPTAAAAVLGIIPKLVGYRPRLALLPEFDLELVDCLEDLARAALHAHVMWASATTSTVPIAGLAEEANGLREQLVLDARSLVLRKLVDASALSELKGGVGYRNIAVDLLELVNVFRSAWPRLQGRTGVTESELDHAESLGAQVLLAVGQREHAEAEAAEVAGVRGRAFTLLVRAYDELRRGIAYLRHAQGDVDSIVPSLFSGKQRSNRSRDDQLPQGSPPSPLHAEAPHVQSAHEPAPMSVDGPFR